MKIAFEKIKMIIRLPMLLSILLILSCNKKENENLPMIKTTPSDFEDVVSIEGSVEADKSTTMSCPDNMDVEVVSMVEDGTMVKAGDVIAVLDNKEFKSQYDQFMLQVENSRTSQEMTKANMKLQYALLEAQVRSINAQTAIANLDSLQLQYLSPNLRRIKELELEKAGIEKQKLEKKLKAMEQINKSQSVSLDIQLKRLESNVQMVKGMLDQLTLKATQSGMAVRVNSMLTGEKIKEGDQAWSGMPLISIPDLSKMKVTILASEANYKRININDPVEFTFDAMPGNFAWGKITKKAPLGKPIKDKSKVKVFEMEASVDSALTLPEPGFTANCNVIRQRIKDMIVIPQIAIFDVDSMKVVYVGKKDNFEERQVLTGATSPNNAVIVAGLSGKEIISLIKPSSSKIKERTLLPKKNKKKIVHKGAKPKQIHTK